VVDASAADALSQITTVHEVLREIGAGQVPEVLVLNKIDIAAPETLVALRRTYPDALQVSAVTGDGVRELRDALAGRLRQLTTRTAALR
jgi:GTP-binding protein HflX